MKKIILFGIALTMLAACKQTEDEKAQPLMQKIETAYEAGEYQTVLDSITRLRNQYPKALETREKALALWQDASIKLAQSDIARTDSMLQATIQAIDAAPTRLEQNLLRNKRDSLQARYDALCGVVRVARAKKEGN